MESYDQSKAQRVWDRVNGIRGNGPDPAALTALMSQELTDAAACIRLAKRIGGRGGDLLKLARQCQQNAGCLRGICAITNRSAPSIAVPTPGEEPAQAILRRCYVNSLHRMREYEALSADPDYGPVFRTMSHAMQRHCASLLELIGKIER